MGEDLTKGVADNIFSNLFDVLGAVNSTAVTVNNRFIEQGGVTGLLAGIGEIASAWNDPIDTFVNYLGTQVNLPETVGKYVSKTVDALSVAPQKISAGIEAIQNGDWVDGIGNILKATLKSAKIYAKGTKVEPFANAFENAGYTAIAISEIIEGAVNGWRELPNSAKDAWKTLKEGWKDDVERYTIEERFKSIFKELGIQIKDSHSLKEMFETARNWVTTEFSGEVKESLLDLLSTLNPFSNRPVPVNP